MFALIVEQEPFTLQDLPAAITRWVQTVGGFCAVALVVWFIAARFVLRRRQTVTPGWQTGLFRIGCLAMVAGYTALFVLQSPAVVARLSGSLPGRPQTAGSLGERIQIASWLLGGGGAILAVALPFLADLVFRWRWRRIWAMARLSFKEALRRKVLWGFSAFALLLLFGSWFISSKPESQVRIYVTAVYWSMTPLLLITAGLLAALSIPADIRNQTIHTIVTKPVERFEIVVGRFIGYVLLITLVLAAMVGISLLYVFREIDVDAMTESMRARVPIFPSELNFLGKEGQHVGREWEYRRYVTGGAASQHRGVFTFQDIPASLGNRESGYVTCEFTFDIFRTLSRREDEGKGVFCSFFFQSRNWNEKQHKRDYDEALANGRKLTVSGDRKSAGAQLYQTILGRAPSESEVQSFLEDKRGDSAERLLNNLLAEKFGYYEIASKEITDYHTQSLEVPTSLFRNASTEVQAHPTAKTAKATLERPPALQLLVKCESRGQYVGMAKYDFYILDRERPFAFNFVKGAVGLWLRLVIVIGLAVVCSTYLSGVVSWLATMFFYSAGLFQEYVREIVENTNVGGGPMQSVVRLITKESMVTELDPTPGNRLAQGADLVYRQILAVVQNVFPSVDRLDWTNYIADGFNISAVSMIIPHCLLVAGYLLPCALVAYYMMKSREIAG